MSGSSQLLRVHIRSPLGLEEGSSLPCQGSGLGHVPDLLSESW